MLKPRHHALVIALACVLACGRWLPPCADQALASELFGDASGQPVQGEAQSGTGAGAAAELVDSLGLVGLGAGLALVPLAYPIAQIASTAAGAGSHDQDHGLGHGQGHGN